MAPDRLAEIQTIDRICDPFINDAHPNSAERHRRELLTEVKRLTQHVDELQAKLISMPDNGKCCCSFEGPGDVCLVHSPTVKRLTARVAELEAGLDTANRRWFAELAQHAAAQDPVYYGQLAAAETGRDHARTAATIYRDQRNGAYSSILLIAQSLASLAAFQLTEDPDDSAWNIVNASAQQLLTAGGIGSSKPMTSGPEHP
jgi:hypothetical protein